VLEAFRIPNRSVAITRRRQLNQDTGEPPEGFDSRKWRPFQIASILLNLVSIADPTHDDISSLTCYFSPQAAVKPRHI
jgi:hypothetical protein